MRRRTHTRWIRIWRAVVETVTPYSHSANSVSFVRLVQHCELNTHRGALTLAFLPVKAQ